MKTYVIECAHDVYIDFFSEGQKEHVNYYDTNGKYKTDSPIEAIEKHLSFLGYQFDKKNSEVDEDEPNKLFFSILADVENNEATEKQIELLENWRENNQN